MLKSLPILVGCGLLAQALVMAQTTKLRVIAFGAHPDDCDSKFGGTAIKLAKAGHAVKFVSVTNGNVGHQTQKAPELAKRRLAEAKEAGRRFGIGEYEVLNNNDGELLPTLEARKQVIRAIRGWNADIVIAPRPNDYHPDHRYTGVLVQDAAYMVVVPHLVPEVPALRKNPIFLYYQDRFQRPNAFRPDVAVSIDDVFDAKINAMDAHISQYYEWLPWVDGRLEEVPKGAAERKMWLTKERGDTPNTAVREALEKRYGAAAGRQVKHAEAFELCEYGRRPTIEELQAMFPK
jgi:LmbE family N-acetylglucosaminyl deacetylase